MQSTMRKAVPNIVTTKTADGNIISWIPHPMFDNSGVTELVSPYFSGDGKELSSFLVFHDNPDLCIGTVLDTGNSDGRCYVSETKTVEDFFENIYIAVCQLITSDPNQVMNTSVKALYCMGSAKPEK